MDQRGTILHTYIPPNKFLSIKKKKKLDSHRKLAIFRNEIYFIILLRENQICKRVILNVRLKK